MVHVAMGVWDTVPSATSDTEEETMEESKSTI